MTEWISYLPVVQIPWKHSASKTALSAFAFKRNTTEGQARHSSVYNFIFEVLSQTHIHNLKLYLPKDLVKTIFFFTLPIRNEIERENTFGWNSHRSWEIQISAPEIPKFHGFGTELCKLGLHITTCLYFTIPWYKSCPVYLLYIFLIMFSCCT